MRQLRTALLTALLAAATALPAGAELFPVPASLEPNVRFWQRVYTEVDSEAGLIHDTRHLDVVYEVVRFPKGLSYRSRERRVEKVKKRYRAILHRLGKGKRTDLTEEEAHVLERWPEGVTDRTLSRAANRIRFQLGQADRFREGLIRSGMWIHHIEATLLEHGVPVELAALPHVESSFNPRAYSRVGAAGLWQFTRSTGRLYLRVDHVVDERMDPHVATVGAVRLLADNYRRLESWPLAITAYNHGVGGMARAAKRLGTRDIGVISQKYDGRTFGFASRNFYSEFLAASAIAQDPERFFGFVQLAPPLRHEILETDAFYTAATLERVLGIPGSTLQEHNLALRPSVWNGAKLVPKGYSLRLPPGALSVDPQVALASIPDAERMARQHRDRFHKVRRGEALSKIARRYGTTQSELVALNNLRSRHRIRAGQVLRLPDDGLPRTVVGRRTAPVDGIYRVERGDNLWVISQRFGISQKDLARWNSLRNRNQLAVGQRLHVSAPPAATPKVLARASSAATDAVVQAPEPATSALVAPQDPPAAEPEPLQPEPLQRAAAPQDDPAPAVSEPTPAAAPLVSEPLAVAVLPVSEPAPVAQEPTGLEPASTEAEPEEPIRIASIAPAENGAPAEAPQRAADASPAVPDPSNYAVTSDDRITVQAEETLGHYAEWLEVPTSNLRRLNRMKYGTPLVIGRQKKLDFSRVSPELFEQRRLTYHREIQEEFFDAWTVTGTTSHTLRRGESLWYVAREKYEIPIWLLRQYNPDLDFGDLHAGTPLVIPAIDPRRN